MLEQESDKLNGELGRGIDEIKNPNVLKVKKKKTWIDSVRIRFGDWSQDCEPLDNHISKFEPN